MLNGMEGYDGTRQFYTDYIEAQGVIAIVIHQIVGLIGFPPTEALIYHSGKMLSLHRQEII
ncbi:MAG: hypothetical protein ACR5K4_00115 [Sodalis sp. (in: enterobacteria)]